MSAPRHFLKFVFFCSRAFVFLFNFVFEPKLICGYTLNIYFAEMDSNIKKELIDELNQLEIKEDCSDWIKMSNGVAFKTSMSFTDNFTVTVDKDEIVVAFGNTTLTYQHNPDSKRYRVMTFREPPCYKIKLMGAQQILNDEVVGTGNLIFSFDTKAEYDNFQEQLEQVRYHGDF